MKPDEEIKKWCVVIIQSLKDDEKQTGTLLYNEILQYRKYQKTYFKCEPPYNVKNKNDFFNLLEALTEKAEKEKEIFTLHLEMHGLNDSNGLSLASDESVTWGELFKYTREININMCNTLILSLSTCYGAAIISYIEPEKRAPFLAFIGTTTTILPSELLRGFQAFYTHYSTGLDIFEAINAINAELYRDNIGFICKSSRYIFNEIFNEKRIDDVLSKNINSYRKRSPGKSDEEIKAEIKQLMMDAKEQNRDHFCFYDLYPENKN